MSGSDGEGRFPGDGGVAVGAVPAGPGEEGGVAGVVEGAEVGPVEFDGAAGGGGVEGGQQGGGGGGGRGGRESRASSRRGRRRKVALPLRRIRRGPPEPVRSMCSWEVCQALLATAK